MTDIIVGERASGKTTVLCEQMAISPDAIFVTFSRAAAMDAYEMTMEIITQRRGQRLDKIAADSLRSRFRVAGVESVRGYDVPILIDNTAAVLDILLGTHRVEAVTFDGIAHHPSDRRKDDR